MSGPERYRIFILDDDAMVLRSWERVLGRRHEVRTEVSAAKALEHLTGAGNNYDAVLVDLGMPEMSGMEFFDRVVALDPAIERHVIFLTGGAVDESASEFLATTDCIHVIKPATITTIEAAVAQTVANAGGRAARDEQA